MDRGPLHSTQRTALPQHPRDRTAPSCWAHLMLTESSQLESNLPPEASPDRLFHALGNTDKVWSSDCPTHLASQLPGPDFLGPCCSSSWQLGPRLSLTPELGIK